MLTFRSWVAVHREKLVTIGIVALVGLAVVTAWPLDLYVSNQGAYFPQGLHLSDPTFLQNDWLVNLRPTHPVFAVIVAAIDRLGILREGAAGLEIGLYLCLLFALSRLIGKVYDSLSDNSLLTATGVNRREFVLVILTIYVFFQNIPELLSAFYNLFDRVGLGILPRGWTKVWSSQGLAGQYIFMRYLQPSEFIILFLLAIALLMHNRWRSSVLLLAIAANIHIGYIVHGAILATTAAVWLYFQGSLRAAVEVVLIYGFATLPAFIGGPLMFSLEPGSREAQHIMVTIRIPHHSLPWEWWSLLQTQKLIFLLLGTILLMWKVPGVLRWIMAVGTVVICVGIVAVLITRNDSLALMHLWRSSVYLYPISQITILVFGVAFAIRVFQRIYRPHWGVTFTGCFVTLMLAVLVQAYRILIVNEPEDGSPSDDQSIAVVVREHTTGNDVILIPANADLVWDFVAFRVESARPVFVEWKIHPYYPSDFQEWWRRIGVVEEFYAATHAERKEICQREGVTYYVLQIEAAVPESDFIAATDAYQLVKCSA